MKITNHPNIQKILGVYKKHTEPVGKHIKLKQEKDKVEISQRAKEFQLAFHAYKQLPEIRKDKVEEIRNQIQSGTYNPSGEEILEKLFDRKV